MNTLHRLLTITTFITAVIAVVFSFLLYERRQELTRRSNLLAETIAEVAVTIDRDSGTRLSEIAHLEPNTPNPDGTLGASSFHSAYGPSGDFGRYTYALEAVAQHARAIQQQRNNLGDALATVAETVEFDAHPSDFTVVADDAYRDAVANLQSHLTKVRTRDRAITTAVADAAVAIDHPVDRRDLEDLDAFRTVVGDFAERLRLLHTRDANYAAVIAQLPEVVNNYTFTFNPDRLKNDPDYRRQLTALQADFAGIKARLQELQRVKIELREIEDELEDHVTAFHDAQDTLRYLDKRHANLEAKHQILKDRLAACRQEKYKPDQLSTRFRGEIVQVDEAYRFIIVNLGAKDALSPNTVLKVGRGSDFVCNVTVSRVERDYAVCEVEPKFRQSAYLAPGDRVIH